MPFREVLNPQSLDIYCFWKSALTPVQRAITFPDHPLPVSTKSHSSTLVFLIESGNAAKRINAFWADVEHIGSHLHLEELLSLKHTSHWLVLDSETPRWSVLYYRPRKNPHIKVASKHSKQDVSSPPTTHNPAFLHLSAFPERNSFLILTHTTTAIPGGSTEMGRFLPCYFHIVYLTFPHMSFR